MMRDFFYAIPIVLIATFTAELNSFAAGDEEKSPSPPPAAEAPVQTKKPNVTGTSTSVAHQLEFNQSKSSSQSSHEELELESYSLACYFSKSHNELNQLLHEGKINSRILLKLGHYALKTPFVSEADLYLERYATLRLDVSNLDEIESKFPGDLTIEEQNEFYALRNSIDLTKSSLPSRPELSLEAILKGFQTGEIAFQQQDWSTALRLLQKASEELSILYQRQVLQEPPDNFGLTQGNWARCKYLIAQCHFHLGNYKEGISQMQLAAVASSLFDAQIQLGMWFEIGIKGQIPQHPMLSEFYYRLALPLSPNPNSAAQRGLERLASKVPSTLIPIIPVYTKTSTVTPPPTAQTFPVFDSKTVSTPPTSPRTSPKMSPLSSPAMSPETPPLSSPAMSPETPPLGSPATAPEIPPLTLT